MMEGKRNHNLSFKLWLALMLLLGLACLFNLMKQVQENQISQVGIISQREVLHKELRPQFLRAAASESESRPSRGERAVFAAAENPPCQDWAVVHPGSKQVKLSVILASNECQVINTQ